MQQAKGHQPKVQSATEVTACESAAYVLKTSALKKAIALVFVLSQGAIAAFI